MDNIMQEVGKASKKRKPGRPPQPNKSQYSIMMDRGLRARIDKRSQELGISFSAFLAIAAEEKLNPIHRFKVVLDD